jgi:hypothetical protein
MRGIGSADDVRLGIVERFGGDRRWARRTSRLSVVGVILTLTTGL